MPIEILTGEERNVAVGQLLTVAVEVTDGSGNLLKKAEVRVKAGDPDAVAIGEDGRPYGTFKTNGKGVAEFDVTALKTGDLEIEIKCGTDIETVTLKAKDTGVVSTGAGGAIARTPGGDMVVLQTPQCQHAQAAPAPRPGRIVVLNLNRR